MRILVSLAMLVMISACKHPLEIAGEGDIVELNGTGRGCTLEQFLAGDSACTENGATGDYIVTYSAVPRDGWVFTGWLGPCLLSPKSPDCSLNTPASWVSYWDDVIGTPVPATVAIFQREGSAGPEPTTIHGRVIGDREGGCDPGVDRVRVVFDTEFVIEASLRPDCTFSLLVPANKLLDLLFVEANGSVRGRLVYGNPYVVQVASETEMLSRLRLPGGDSLYLGDIIVDPDLKLAFSRRDPLTQLDSDRDGLNDAVDADLAVVDLLNPVEGDLDADGASNRLDNCPFLSNPAQADGNGDGRGDACETPISVLHGRLQYVMYRQMTPQQVAELRSVIDELGSFPLEVTVTDDGVRVGPVAQKGSWVVVGDSQAMVDENGDFTLHDVAAGADRAQVFFDPTEGEPIYGFPLALLSESGPEEAVIEVEVSYSEPCGMDGESCPHHLTPPQNAKSTLITSFDQAGFARHRQWLQPAEEGQNPGDPDPCSDDYNTRACCLDYDGPLGDGTQLSDPNDFANDIAVQYRVFIDSTCDEAVEANCCIQEGADPRYMNQVFWETVGWETKEKFVPRQCYLSHKYRNCQWIRYDTLDGLYASVTPPLVNPLSAFYDELKNPQDGLTRSEEVTVACNESVDVHVYNNVCSNTTWLTFFPDLGGQMTLNAGGDIGARRLLVTRRYPAFHYRDSDKHHEFTRTLTYVAPSRPSSGNEYDRLLAESGGMTREIRFKSECDIDDGGGGDPDTDPPIIDVSGDSGSQLIFDHYHESSPCPHLIGTILIDNAGGGELMWEIKVPSWITAEPSSGTGAAEVKLYYNCGVAEPGNLLGDVLIEAGDAENPQVRIPIAGSVSGMFDQAGKLAEQVNGPFSLYFMPGTAVCDDGATGANEPETVLGDLVATAGGQLTFLDPPLEPPPGVELKSVGSLTGYWMPYDRASDEDEFARLQQQYTGNAMALNAKPLGVFELARVIEYQVQGFNGRLDGMLTGFLVQFAGGQVGLLAEQSTTDSLPGFRTCVIPALVSGEKL